MGLSRSGGLVPLGKGSAEGHEAQDLGR